jgi:hypothetical protein
LLFTNDENNTNSLPQIPVVAITAIRWNHDTGGADSLYILLAKSKPHKNCTFIILPLYDPTQA